MSQRKKKSKKTSVPSIKLTNIRDVVSKLDSAIQGEEFNYGNCQFADDKIGSFGPRPKTPPFTPNGQRGCEPLDFSKPVCSRDGWPAVLFEVDLTKDRNNAFPVKGFLFDNSPVESTWTLTGQYVNSPTPHLKDLFNVTQEDWDKAITSKGFFAGEVK